MPTKLVEQFVAGERLGATRLNRIVDEINNAAAEREPFGSVAVEARDGARSFVRLEVKAFAQPDLVCVLPGEAANPSAREYTVKLPTIFIESTRDIGLASPVTYVYSSVNTRTASSPGETNETQVITPPFVVGEVVEVFATDAGTYQVSTDGRFWGVSS